MRILLIALLAGFATFAVADTKPKEDSWKPLFDGKTLEGWKASGFAGEAESVVEDGKIVIPMSDRLTGITYKGDVPKTDYEVELVARRVSGTDFFVGLTFPVADSHASLILGGWGGAVCGISNLDDEDANHNETRKIMRFVKEQWYKVRLRVEPKRIQAWIDDKPVIDVDITGKKITTRPEIDLSKPFGLSTFATTAEIKSIRLRPIPAEEKRK